MNYDAKITFVPLRLHSHIDRLKLLRQRASADIARREYFDARVAAHGRTPVAPAPMDTSARA